MLLSGADRNRRQVYLTMKGTSSSSRRLELNPSATEGQRRPRIRSTGYRLGLSATLPGLDNNDSDTNKPHPQSSTKPSMPQFSYIIPVVQLGQKCMLISMVKKWYNLQHSSVCLKNHYLSRCRFFYPCPLYYVAIFWKSSTASGGKSSEGHKLLTYLLRLRSSSHVRFFHFSPSLELFSLLST